MTVTPTSPEPRRVDALDALRGFAILTMVLSGMVPRHSLPSWMYHAQIPPPEHRFDPTLAGLTWVDLVFPFFLFAMGAAIPLALSNRIARGIGAPRLVGQVLLRGLLLLAFAIYIPHVDPWRMSDEPTLSTWLLALLAFALMFPALARLPRNWSPARVWATRMVGWGGAAVLVIGVWYIAGDRLTSSWTTVDGALANVNRIAERSDIIIVVLANVAVYASIIWLLCARSVAARLAIMLALIGLRLAHHEPGWVKALWEFHPVPRLHQLYFAQYLLIVLPGTIAGDLFREWLSATEPHAPPRWSSARLAAIAGLALVLHVFVLCGLQARWLPWLTPLATIGLLAAGVMLVRRPQSTWQRLLLKLSGWGAAWLMVGLLFEPYEGGIKKDHPTISYYFVTSGLAFFALIFFSVLLDGFRWRRGAGLLIGSGQNPMIAYLGVRNLLPPLLVPMGLDGWLTRLMPTPWLGALRALLKTVLLAWLVQRMTRMRIYWRT